MFRITVNGVARKVACDPETTLLDVLREKLRMTGTKRGCDIGVCGTCTVLIDGKAKRACKVKIKDVAVATPPLTHPSPLRGEGFTSSPSPLGGEGFTSSPSPLRGEGLNSSPSPLGGEGRGEGVVTIEGLERDGKLHPIQQAFVDCGAIQCGFCTPGMLLQAKALLDENPRPTRDEIKKALAANLCRCTGYQQIFEAIEEAAKRMRASY